MPRVSAMTRTVFSLPFRDPARAELPAGSVCDMDVPAETMNNLSVQVRKAAWSGLSAGNDSFRAGVFMLSSSKTCPLESGHCRLERPLHASQPMSMPSTEAHCGDYSAPLFVAHSSLHLQILAPQGNLTRVITVMYGREGSR